MVWRSACDGTGGTEPELVARPLVVTVHVVPWPAVDKTLDVVIVAPVTVEPVIDKEV